ncbi:mannan endo-1,4-beta-mannosidase 7-like [Gossypium hirsutum]|uniref:Mannan endo-1,4-beta-mannosidase 7-like n=1 Tax=Gossypium hirsutum TaxID=3635 RepID=A0ABM2ZRW0_GOSHI|nr:mannan endo-1,4-beta-mannosidase 7-like [Gossypium hirsutum]
MRYLILRNAWIMEMAYHVKSVDKNHLVEAGLEGFYGRSTPLRMKLNPCSEIGTGFIANNLIPAIDFSKQSIHILINCNYHVNFKGTRNSSSKSRSLAQRSHSRHEIHPPKVGHWLDAHIRDAEYVLQNPIIVANFGKSRKDPSSNTYKRDQLFDIGYHKLYTSAKGGAAASGSMFWQLLSEGMDSFRDGYELY